MIKNWFTLYTLPKPPCPMIFTVEKLLVAFAIVTRSNNWTSRSSTCLLLLSSVDEFPTHKRKYNIVDKGKRKQISF